MAARRRKRTPTMPRVPSGGAQMVRAVAAPDVVVSSRKDLLEGRVTGQPRPKDLVAGRPTTVLTAKRKDQPGFRSKKRESTKLSKEARQSLRLIAAFNPDASLARFQALNLALHGLSWNVWKRDAKGDVVEEEDEAGAQYVADLNDRVNHEYGGGGLSALAAQAFLLTWEQGGGGIELDVANSLRDVADMFVVDPEQVDFLEAEVDDGGVKRIMKLPALAGKRRSQVADDEDVDWFNPFTFRYAPFMPAPGDPYGTPVMLPALDTAFPQQALRDALEKLVRSHAWAKPEIILSEEKILASLEGATDDEKATAIEDELGAYKKAMEEAEPDDYFVHTDVATTDVMSAEHGNASINADGMIKWADQDQIVALKSLPTIMGRSWGQALSSSGAQEWVIYAKGIETLRDHVLGLVGWAVNQCMRIAGVPGFFEFAPVKIRAEDRVAEADALLKMVQAWKELLTLSLATKDEAAMELLGHNAPEIEEEPKVEPKEEDDDKEDDEPEDEEEEPAEEEPEEEPEADSEEDRLWDQVMGGTPVVERSAEELEREAWRPREGQRFLSPAQIAALQGDEPDEDDVDAVSRQWDKVMDDVAPELKGLLLAKTGGKPSVSRAAGQESGWTFELKYLQYRGPAPATGGLGKLLTPGALAQAQQRALEADAVQAARLAARLTTGAIDGEKFVRGMTDLVKRAHVRSQVLARGGKERMTAATYGRAGGLLSRDLRYLGRFSEAIRGGTLSEKEIAGRATMYFEANVRRGFEETRRDMHQEQGWSLERRVLRSVKPCETCSNEASLGWVVIGRLSPIGVGTKCGPADKCEMEFRYSAERQSAP